MTLWSDFQQAQPAVARLSEVALEAVRRPAQIQPHTHLGVRGYRDFGFPRIAAEIAADPDTVELGIYGNGAWVSDADELVPALFVQPGMVAPGGAALADSALAGLIPPRLLEELANVAVIPLAQPSQYASNLPPGAGITIGSRNATAGIWVQCRQTAQTGFLTAAHAAPTTGAVVRSGQGAAIGTVLRTLHRGVGASLAATADVAMVEASTGVSSGHTSLPIRSVAALDQVVLQVARRPGASWIRGLSPLFAVTPQDAPWGEVGITAAAISVAGDSGAPVTTNGHVVAHLVGGARSDYSVVQDVVYQLDEIDANAI